MNKKIISILVLFVVGIVLISGCVKKDIAHIPQDELEKICAKESWPPTCSMVPDAKGRELCERCVEIGYKKEEEITKKISGSEILQELCEKESWPSDCSLVPDLKGKEMCKKCKELTGEEDIGEIKPSDITQITFFKGVGVNRAFDPDWSSDGSQIVFGRHVGGEDEEGGLYIINSDGTGLFKIGSSGYDGIYNPSWNPVNNKILCTGGKYSDLYIIDLDVDKTKMAALGVQPVLFQAWSPDGTKIVYSVYDDSNAPIPYVSPQCEGIGVSASIWIMNSDGTGKTQLTTEEDGYCSDPSFSPDGSKIVYNKGFINPGVPYLLKEGANEIWVMNNDGSNKHLVYTTGDSLYFLHQHAWGKNNKIIFERIQWEKPPEIWIMNSDGTNPMPIVRPKKDPSSFLYADTALDNNGTKIVTTQWKSASEKTPEIMMDRNVVTFTLEE